MRLVCLRLAVIVGVGVALIAAVVVIFRQSRQLASYRQQQSADQAKIRQLQGTLRLREMEKVPTESAPPETDAHRAALAQRDATIARLKKELGAAQDNVAQLQAQLLSAGDQREKALASAGERYHKEQTEWQARLDALQQEVDSAEEEARASRLRIADLEASNAKLANSASEGSSRAAETGRLVASLQSLERRRDTYLTSIIRRYRDITSQFRAMSGMLDSARDGNSSAFNDAALMRIQNAVSLADDDLRQLNDLNAQISQLEKKLLKK